MGPLLVLTAEKTAIPSFVLLGGSPICRRLTCGVQGLLAKFVSVCLGYGLHFDKDLLGGPDMPATRFGKPRRGHLLERLPSRSVAQAVIDLDVGKRLGNTLGPSTNLILVIQREEMLL